MVIQIHSFGSLWQIHERPAGAAIWNTTGVMVQGSLRSRAVTYGQVSLGLPARSLFARFGDSLRGRWQAELERGDRLVRLGHPVSRKSVPNYSLVCISSQMIGTFTTADLENQSLKLISFSSYKNCAEALMLMRPFGWVRGSRGSVTLIRVESSFRLRLLRWE